MASCRHYAHILLTPLLTILAVPLRFPLALLLGLLYLFPTTLSAQPLPNRIALLLKKHHIPLSAVSLQVQEAGSQYPLVSLNSHTLRNPASVIKLLTTLSALELLGPAYQWHTRYWADGSIHEGILQGDLVLQGGGDPFITVDKFLHQILSIRQLGIHTITGDLVIDNTLFATTNYDRSQFDGQSLRLYNVEADAALVNFSATRFVIQPLENRIVVFADPPLADLVVENNITARAGKCLNRNAGWHYGLHQQGQKLIARFDGNYRSHCGQHALSRAVFSNREYSYRLFKYLWGVSGGRFDGGYRMAETPAHAHALLSYPSVPLADIITGINKYSNNVMARQLLLSIDAQTQDPQQQTAATRAGGRAVIRRWLSEHVGNMPDLIIDNGAGLSRKSRITTANLTTLLQHGWRSNYHAEFLSSLPLAALDGTMKKRLQGSALSARARIKTGLINGVRSMAGFVNASNNKLYTVAMMIESKNVNFNNGNAIQDAVLEWLYHR